MEYDPEKPTAVWLAFVKILEQNSPLDPRARNVAKRSAGETQAMRWNTVIFLGDFPHRAGREFQGF